MDKDIAIIGIGCNFPGGKYIVSELYLYYLWQYCVHLYDYSTTFTGEGVDSFWKVLVEGRNCVVQIQDERFDTSEWFHPDESKPGKTQTTKAALIEG